MAEAALSQAEVWDDSVLVNSWNEAFEEYKKYHSLAAKGEKVDLTAFRAEQGLVNGNTQPGPAKHSSAAVHLEQEPKNEVPGNAYVEQQASAGAVDAGPAHVAPTVSATPAIPQALAATVQNEDLKNLMMSWYYAGYYTGLYEGKQQGHASARQQQGG